MLIIYLDTSYRLCILAGMESEITKAQQRVLTAIIDYRKKYKNSPTLRYLAKEFGQSPNSTIMAARRLVKKNLLVPFGPCGHLVPVEETR